MNAQTEIKEVVLSQEEKEHVRTILAQTDWAGYWREVSVAAQQEIEAYASARAKSLGAASRRFLR